MDSEVIDEAEWRESPDATRLWHSLGGRASDRKNWLFACACCRALPGYLESEGDRLVLEAAERHVEGVDSLKEMQEHFGATAWDIRFHRLNSWEAVNRILESIWVEFEDDEAAWAEYADLLRDAFGNPFRPAAIDPSWLTAEVVGLARRVYDERAFSLMTALGSALEEAGCEDTDILSHCRQTGPHVRGCWVLDLILGKG